MRPKFLSPRNLILLLLAAVVFGGLARWGSLGFPLPGQGVPSTAGMMAFVTEKGGKSDVALLNPSTGAIAAISTDGQGNDEPAFTPDGSVLFFTGERAGIRQIIASDAAPGRTVVALTRTTTTKQQPQARPDGRVYFVDGGKISATTRDATDPKAIFPSAEALNHNPYLKALFREGGIGTVVVSADEKMMALTINREQGQLLVVYGAAEDEHGGDGHDHGGVILVLGLAKKIIPQFTPSGMLGALFIGGAPFNKPMQIPNPTDEEAEQMRAEMREMDLPIPPLSEGMKDVNMLAQFGNDMTVGGQVPLPAPPKELAFAPSKDVIAIAGDDKGDQAGLILLPMGGEQITPKQIYNKPCQDIAWSPDASMIAFSDGTDIFVVPADGSAPPKNITGGKAGKATRPVWSPAEPKN